MCPKNQVRYTQIRQMELIGNRILLRDFRDDDLDPLISMHSDPRVLRYYASEVGTREHGERLLDLFVRWAAEVPRQNFQLAVIDRESGVLMGSCGLRMKGCPARCAEFGLGIDAEWWGQGLAQEAARLLLRFGFTDLDLVEVRGVSVAQNEAVATLVRRLGFSEGEPRRGETWMEERGWTAVDWLLTREAWKRAAGQLGVEAAAEGRRGW